MIVVDRVVPMKKGVVNLVLLLLLFSTLGQTGRFPLGIIMQECDYD